MSKHTPGPWLYDSLDRVVIRAGIEDIAHMDRSASDADARLIAAAPELLEALNDLLEEYEDRRAQFGSDDLWHKHKDANVIQKVRLVLDKIRGES